MNIFSFLEVEKKTNNQFIAELFDTQPICFSSKLKANLLNLIEWTVKKRIIQIISYESKVAIKANLVSTDEQFINELSSDTEWIRYFYDEYPILESYLPHEYNSVRTLLKYVVNCLIKDYALLKISQNCLLDDIIITGDIHADLATCKLVFTNNYHIYFKPRSLKIDSLILTFLNSVEKQTQRKMFYPVENIDQGDYGWSKTVILEDCKNLTQVEDYYYNLGFLISVSHMLNLEDLIYDNLISTNGLIALIDLECSFSIERPINPDSQFIMNTYAGKQFIKSINNSGILPRNTVDGIYGEGESDGSLSYIPNRKQYQRNFITDNGHFVAEALLKSTKSSENHIPKLMGEAIPVKQFYNHVLNGFRFGYFYFKENKNELIQFIRMVESQNVETRVIWRPTKIYDFILTETFKPNSLKSPSHKNRVLKHLENGTYIGIPKNIVKSEIKQLKNYDIPAFKKNVGTPEIYDFSRNPVNYSYGNITDVDYVINKINNLGYEDFEIQLKILKNSLKIFENVTINEIPKWESITTTSPPLAESYLKVLITHLKDNLYIKESGISAIDIISNVNNGWECGVIGPGLSNGLDGIALLFGTYGHLYKDLEYSNMAKGILQKNFKDFLIFSANDNHFKVIGNIMVSPFQFPVSILYVNEVLHELTGDYIIPNWELFEQIKIYINKWLHRDEHYDFLIGSGGLIFLLYQLFNKTGDQKYLELLSCCSEHLYKNVITNEKHAYWEAEKFKQLGGFSHGTSSLSVAMLISYKLLKKEKYYLTFEKALNYDRSLFNSDVGAYLDTRYTDEPQYSNAWAHGAGGIGLSRLIIDNLLPDYPGIKDEIITCRNLLAKQFQMPIKNYSINGGFSGNIEILKALNKYAKDESINCDTLFSESILHLINNPAKLLSERNHLHLFINQGISGLAYSILRFTHPEIVPSILVLGINNNFGSPHLYSTK